MSSRNVYLSADERAAAPALFQALQATAAGFTPASGAPTACSSSRSADSRTPA